MLAMAAHFCHKFILEKAIYPDVCLHLKGQGTQILRKHKYPSPKS